MEVNGQPHAPTALPPQKEARDPSYTRLGGPQSQFGSCGVQINLLSLPGNEPRLAAVLTELYCTLKFQICTSNNATDMQTTFCPCWSLLFYSAWAGDQGVGVWFPTGARDVSRPALGHIQPAPVQWVLGAVSPGVKQEGCEADHSPPSSSEVKNDRGTPPPTVRLRVVVRY
jgi:hypothetical protein